MKIKESIYQAISTMSIDELIVLYEQISIFEKVKNISVKKEQRFSIEEIHQMTSASAIFKWFIIKSLINQVSEHGKQRE